MSVFASMPAGVHRAQVLEHPDDGFVLELRSRSDGRLHRRHLLDAPTRERAVAEAILQVGLVPTDRVRVLPPLTQAAGGEERDAGDLVYAWCDDEDRVAEYTGGAR